MSIDCLKLMGNSFLITSMLMSVGCGGSDVSEPKSTNTTLKPLPPPALGGVPNPKKAGGTIGST